ncbi:MAG: hypothetical protein V4796_31470 [Burkholderia cenocepacia]
MSEEQQNQPTGIVGEIVEGLHSLEQKVDTFLHPAASDNAPSSTEPVQEAGGAAPGEVVTSAAAPASANALDLAASSSDSTANAQTSGDPAGSSASSTESLSGSGVAGEAGNVAAASSATAAAQDAASPSAQTSPSSDQSDAATTGASADDPNAAAPTAGDPSASDTQSSASPVSQVGEGLAIAASVSEAVASRVYVLRRHFWTFDEAARAPFIKLLDEIEALVK